MLLIHWHDKSKKTICFYQHKLKELNTGRYFGCAAKARDDNGHKVF
jgi:hypothetical protein